MTPPDKLPESRNTPASSPTEGGVSPEMQRQRQVVAVDRQIAEVDDATRSTMAARQAQVDQVRAAAEGVDPDVDVDDLVTEEGQEKARGMFSGVSDFLASISTKLGELGKGLRGILQGIFGEKKSESGADTDEDADDDNDYDSDEDTLVPFATPERMVEDHEMQTPDAPVFSFLKTYMGTLYVSDVPSVRHIHPVSGKRNVPHRGVDIPAPIGTALHLTGPMTILSKKGSTLKGKLDDGTVVSFLHLNKMTTAKEGERLPRGAWFADVGNKGGSTGPHLHFEVNGGKTDALRYLDPGLLASAEKKIQEKKTGGLWTPLVSDEHPHGVA